MCFCIAYLSTERILNKNDVTRGNGMASWGVSSALPSSRQGNYLQKANSPHVDTDMSSIVIA